jgi:hypothetical protein
MLRLTDAQRAVLIHAIPAVANLGIGTMVFGQFLRQKSFSIGLALSGLSVRLVLVGLTVILAGGKR